MKQAFLAFVLAFVLGFSIIFLINHAYGHDHNKPELNKWFDSLKNGNGGPCCSNADGTVITDSDWEATSDGHYRVYLEGRWRDVPDSAVLHEPNLDGRTIVWPIRAWKGTEPDIIIRCFIPGTMT